MDNSTTRSIPSSKQDERSSRRRTLASITTFAHNAKMTVEKRPKQSMFFEKMKILIQGGVASSIALMICGVFFTGPKKEKKENFLVP